MATPATPVTPAAQKAAQPTPTGKWRHPQFDEITRRQYTTNFDDRNVRQIIWNGGFLIGSFLLKPATLKWSLLRVLTSPLFGLTKYSSYTWWLVTAIRLLFLLNIGIALLPLFRRYRKDDITDIPLTPSQRQAMGLDPNASPTPHSPGSAYASPNFITPPRYQKSTPRSSLSNQGERRAGDSPLSGSQRGLGKSTSNSPFSPSSGSPLFQRAVGSSSRRMSYDRHSPLSNSLFGESSSSNTPGTPTPATGRASVGLNNKWLYEKGRPSPRSSFYAL